MLYRKAYDKLKMWSKRVGPPFAFKVHDKSERPQ